MSADASASYCSSSSSEDEGESASASFARKIEKRGNEAFVELMCNERKKQRRDEEEGEEEEKETEERGWANVMPAERGRVTFRLSEDFWFTVEHTEMIPTVNKFVELFIVFERGEPSTQLLAVEDARPIQKIPAKTFNIEAARAGLENRVPKSKKFWTNAAMPKLLTSQVAHLPLFRVLCREPPYFKVLLEYGDAFADQLSDLQLRALAGKDLLRPFMVPEIPEHLWFWKPRSASAAQWGKINETLEAYRAWGKRAGFTPQPGLVDEGGELLMAKKLHPMLEAASSLFTLEAARDADGCGAEQMSDTELRRLVQAGQPVTLRGNPRRLIVDPLLRESYTGFAFLCSLHKTPIADFPADGRLARRRHVFEALTDPAARVLFKGKFHFFHFNDAKFQWSDINKLLGLSAPPAANKLILCASATILQTVEHMMLPREQRKSASSGKATVLANVTTFTTYFGAPRKDVTMILDGKIPLSLVAESVGLATEKITILFAPGTPDEKRTI